MIKFLNNRTAKFPFNNRGETPTGTPPAGTPPAGTPPAPVVPKTKEEWDALRTSDPTRWMDLTQSRMDQSVREGREAKEKLAAAEAREKNYQTELANLKKGGQPPAATPPAATPPAGTPGVFDPEKPASKDNMPQTDQDWDRLFLENPRLATDLRVEQANQQGEFRKRQVEAQTDFIKSRKKCAEELQQRHPDMYVQELDGEGKPKVDEKGKPVLKIDPNTGAPILNLESEKGKLWVEVYSEDLAGYDSAKTGIRSAMHELERRLVDRGTKKVGDANAPATPGSGAAPAGSQNGTMPGGVTPPVIPSVSFATDEEKQHAEKAVQRGVYKDLGEYCRLRDGKNTGFTESGRTPDFSKK